MWNITSGSVLGPLIVSELLKRGEATIAICIGSTASGIEAHNTLKTISTLQNISVNKLEKPLVCSFYINSEETTRDVVDSQIDNDIRALALLVSGSNKELDATDLSNWLEYTSVTNIPPQLVDLVIYCIKPGTPELGEMNAISVASLLPKVSDSVIDLGQPYSCVGYMPDSVVNASDATMLPMHFIITNGLLNARMEELISVSAKFSETKQMLMDAAVLHTVDESNDDGMCF